MGTCGQNKNKLRKQSLDGNENENQFRNNLSKFTKIEILINILLLQYIKKILMK